MADLAPPDIYELGEHVGVAASFGTAEDPLDPPGVRFQLRPPGGRVLELTFGESPAIARPRPGTYQVVVSASEAGRWHWRFSALGGPACAVEGAFEVFDVGGS